MNLQSAKALTEDLMEKHGLFEQGWQFQWSASNTFNGEVFYAEKLLVLSTRLTSVNSPEVVENTIRHELAHALLGPGYGHGPVWRAKAAELGAAPTAKCRNGRRAKLLGNLVMAA